MNPRPRFCLIGTIRKHACLSGLETVVVVVAVVVVVVVVLSANINHKENSSISTCEPADE